MSGLFFIGDTHFGHHKIAVLRGFGSVQEHDEYLIEQWNATVRKRDTVWHLGDVLFGKHSFACLERLNGTKKLVAGNHDQYPTAEYLKHFNKVLGAAEVNGWLLTHIPVDPSQFRRWSVNVHGHTHSNSLPDARYVCVSAEQTGLRPTSVDEVTRRAG